MKSHSTTTGCKYSIHQLLCIEVNLACVLMQIWFKLNTEYSIIQPVPVDRMQCCSSSVSLLQTYGARLMPSTQSVCHLHLYLLYVTCTHTPRPNHRPFTCTYKTNGLFDDSNNPRTPPVKGVGRHRQGGGAWSFLARKFFHFDH